VGIGVGSGAPWMLTEPKRPSDASKAGETLDEAGDNRCWTRSATPRHHGQPDAIGDDRADLDGSPLQKDAPVAGSLWQPTAPCARARSVSSMVGLLTTLCRGLPRQASEVDAVNAQSWVNGPRARRPRSAKQAAIRMTLIVT